MLHRFATSLAAVAALSLLAGASGCGSSGGEETRSDEATVSTCGGPFTANQCDWVCPGDNAMSIGAGGAEVSGVHTAAFGCQKICACGSVVSPPDGSALGYTCRDSSGNFVGPTAPPPSIASGCTLGVTLQTASGYFIGHEWACLNGTPIPPSLTSFQACYCDDTGCRAPNGDEYCELMYQGTDLNSQCTGPISDHSYSLLVDVVLYRGTPSPPGSQGGCGNGCPNRPLE
jgi:hypothetical protein